MGILPGAGGTMNMTRLVDSARALEPVLGAELVGAQLAGRYGLVDRAIPARGALMGCGRPVRAAGPGGPAAGHAVRSAVPDYGPVPIHGAGEPGGSRALRTRPARSASGASPVMTSR